MKTAKKEKVEFVENINSNEREFSLVESKQSDQVESAKPSEIKKAVLQKFEFDRLFKLPTAVL